MARRARRRHPRRDGPREPAAHPARQGIGRALRDSAAADGRSCGRVGYQGKPPPGENGILMEVKPGHKQTEVGVIPEDWEVSPLEEFTSLISYGFTNPMPTAESGVYMITAKDINQGRIQFDTARCTTE